MTDLSTSHSQTKKGINNMWRNLLIWGSAGAWLLLGPQCLADRPQIAWKLETATAN